MTIVMRLRQNSELRNIDTFYNNESGGKEIGALMMDDSELMGITDGDPINFDDAWSDPNDLHREG